MVLSSTILISIHALREEGDVRLQALDSRVEVFLSTPSARRATISSWSSDLADIIFLSTPSARRATRERGRDGRGYQISIHALREEGDAVLRAELERDVISIHALREEGDGHNGFFDERQRDISIHALREEGDSSQN